MPQSVASSGSPTSGRKRALPRKTDAKACPRDASYLTRVTRSGIGYSALPATPDGGVIVDLLSSTAADQDTFSLSLCVHRSCACRTDGWAIGASKSMVLGKLASSTKVDHVWPASRPP